MTPSRSMTQAVGSGRGRGDPPLTTSTPTVRARYPGAYAHRGCTAFNTHAVGERDDPDIRAALGRRHTGLREEPRKALLTRATTGAQTGTDAGATATRLTLHAYGSNRAPCRRRRRGVTATVPPTLDVLGTHRGACRARARARPGLTWTRCSGLIDEICRLNPRTTTAEAPA